MQENWAGLINCVERWRAVSSLKINSKTHKVSHFVTFWSLAFCNFTLQVPDLFLIYMGSIYCTLHTSKLYVMSCAVYIWRKQCKFGHFLQGKARSEFPAYIRDSIDGYLEESHKSTVLDVIGSFVNSKRYPPLQILHTIIQSLLVVSFRSQNVFTFILAKKTCRW